MFGIEQIQRRCLLTLSDGSKIQATITIPKPTKPIFPEQMERQFIENFNNSQPLAVNMVLCALLMRLPILIYPKISIS
jgi:hypothetical protein